MNSLGEVLMCSVCLERFEKPRRLSCGHCFCLSCLEQLPLPRCCPECRIVFIQEPNDLTPDYKLQQLLDLISEQKKLACFYCESESIEVCSHCQKFFCEICLCQHWRSINSKRSNVLQESLRGFASSELLRWHCQSTMLESIQNAREECHRLIDRQFDQNEDAANERYGQTNLKFPEVQLFAESGFWPGKISQMTNFFESNGGKLSECHNTLEKMCDDMMTDLRNLRDCVNSLRMVISEHRVSPCQTSSIPLAASMQLFEKLNNGVVGTRKYKLTVPTRSDTIVINGTPHSINTRHRCITAMGGYENDSLEELRWQDYQIGLLKPLVFANARSRKSFSSQNLAAVGLTTGTSESEDVTSANVASNVGCPDLVSLFADMATQGVTRELVSSSSMEKDLNLNFDRSVHSLPIVRTNYQEDDSDDSL